MIIEWHKVDLALFDQLPGKDDVLMISGDNAKQAFLNGDGVEATNLQLR